MTTKEIELLLAPARSEETKDISGLEIMTRPYDQQDDKVLAKFASGVLADFAITTN